MLSRLDFRHRQWRFWGVSALTIVTFFLRFWNLGFLSLTGDEAYDVLFASQPLAQVLEGLRFVQPYPPLFHTGLHVWLNLAGSSELAVRYWAAMCTTLLVPAVFALGARLFNDRVAFLAALLAAVSPFVQWWGRDAHFYGYVVLWATLLNLAAVMFWQSNPLSLSNNAFRRNRLRYVLIALASLLTHYFTALPWGALNLVALFKTLTGRWTRRLTVNWWGAQIVVVLLYVPWLIWGSRMLTAFDLPGMEQPPPWEAVWQILVAFTLGQASFSTNETVNAVTLWPAVLLTALLVVGIAKSWLRGRFRQSIAICLTLLLAPLTLIYLVSFYRPMFDPKYTIIFVPAFLLLLAAAIIELARSSRLIGLLAASAAVSIMLVFSVQVTADLSIAKSPDWRSSFEFIHRNARAGDVLVYNFPEASVLYYNDKQLPVALVPSTARSETQIIDSRLESVAAGHNRIWFVPLNRSWWDPDGETLRWLNRHTDRAEQRFFRGVHVNLYLAPSAWQSAMTEQPVRFSDGIDLLGFRMTAGRSANQGEPIPGSEPLELEPGDTLGLSLFWQSNGPTDIPFTVFTHLVGHDGLVYGQWDNPPVGGTYPTTEWQPAEQIVDQYTIPLAENAPPGAYRIVVGMYDPATGERVAVLDENGQLSGDAVQLEQLLMVQPNP